MLYQITMESIHTLIEYYNLIEGLWNNWKIEQFTSGENQVRARREYDADQGEPMYFFFQSDVKNILTTLFVHIPINYPEKKRKFRNISKAPQF
jgi:hypothetical protein